MAECKYTELTSFRVIHFARHLVDAGATPRVDASTIACPRCVVQSQMSQIVNDPLPSHVDMYPNCSPNTRQDPSNMVLTRSAPVKVLTKQLRLTSRVIGPPAVKSKTKTYPKSKLCVTQFNC